MRTAFLSIVASAILGSAFAQPAMAQASNQELQKWFDTQQRDSMEQSLRNLSNSMNGRVDTQQGWRDLNNNFNNYQNMQSDSWDEDDTPDGRYYGDVCDDPEEREYYDCD